MNNNLRIMKTIIYVVLENSDIPEEVYIPKEWTNEQIREYLSEKYGKENWMMFDKNKIW